MRVRARLNLTDVELMPPHSPRSEEMVMITFLVTWMPAAVAGSGKMALGFSDDVSRERRACALDMIVLLPKHSMDCARGANVGSRSNRVVATCLILLSSRT